MTRIGEERRSWTIWHAVAAVAALAIGILLTRNAWEDMLRIAVMDEESSHVLLVPIALVWLVWVRKGRFKQCRPGRSFIGTALIGIGWMLWDMGYRRPVQSFFHLGAVLVAVGC